MLNIKKSILYIPLIILISLFFSYQNLGEILLKDNFVQDDFRQSFFWIWQFWDKELFQDFFFVQMYQSHLTRIPLLNLIYHLAPLVSPSPILFAKILSIIIAALSSIAAYFMMLSFLLTKSITQAKFSKNELNSKFKQPSKAHFIAFCFSCCVSTMLWCTDYVSVAHSRSFIWLGIFCYLYLENEKKDILKSIWIFILLLLSPICFLLCLGMQFFSYTLHLISKIRASNHKISFQFKSLKLFNTDFLSLLFNSSAVLLLYKVIFANIATQGVGKEFSRTELEKLPEFNPGGRHPIFGTHIFDREWWSDGHWGLNIASFEISVIVWASLFIVPLYFLTKKYLLKKKTIVSFSSPLFLLLYSSLSLYLTAQILFPMLFLPSRYIANSSFILAISSLCLIITELFSYLETYKNKKYQHFTYIGFSLITIVFTLIYSHFYHPRYVSISTELRNEILKTPKDSLFAAHPKSNEINILSATAKRKAFINHEWSMAYTHESLSEIRRRNGENLKMIYASSYDDLMKIAKTEGITHFIIDPQFYSPKYLKDPKYLEPYNSLLKKLILKGKEKGFYLKKFLKDKHSVIIIEIKDLEPETAI